MARGIEHLVVDLPSIDRGRDGGRLCGHRLFFGLPPGSVQREEATRPLCTITELAHFPDWLKDGPCGLQLQLPDGFDDWLLTEAITVGGGAEYLFKDCGLSVFGGAALALPFSAAASPSPVTTRRCAGR